MSESFSSIPADKKTQEDYQSLESKKAVATLEAAAFFDEIEFPTDFKSLENTSPEVLQQFRESITSKIDEVSYDENGEVLNENRFVAKLLSQRLNVLNELLQTFSSGTRAAEMFEQMDQV